MSVLIAGAPAPAEAKGCHEHSDVVGYQHCGHFGTWSPDDPGVLLLVDVGDLTERFDTRNAELVDGTVMRTGLSHITASAFTMRVLVGWRLVPRLTLYTGGELAVGGLIAAPDQLTGALDREDEFFAAHALVSAHTLFGRIGLSAELAAGARYAGVIACPNAMCTHLAYATEGSGELDARARVEFWFAPNGSAGVAVGQSVVDSSDRELLVVLTLHTRAFDGL